MTVASISRRPVSFGLIAWVMALAFVPAPVAARLWLAVPLVLVPRLAPALAVAGLRRSSAGNVAPVAAWPWLAVAAGLLAAVSITVVTGSAAAGTLATPWWLLTLAGMFTAVQRLRAERTWAPTLLGLTRFVADAFLLLGATAFLADRLALDPMGSGAAIVLLTAVHFSVAGYALVVVAGLLAARGSRPAGVAAVGLMIGIPLTALGFVIDSPLAGWPGSVEVAVSGLLAAIALARAARGSWRADLARLGGAIALAVGMLLALGWSTAQVLGVAYLDLDAMVRTHGALNLLAVLAAAWTLAPDPRPVPPGVRPVRHMVGAMVALAIGVPVAMVTARLDFGTLDRFPVGLAVGALVGPAIAGWVVASRHPWPIARRARAAVLLATVTVLVACLATAVIAGLGDTVSSSAPLASVGFIFIAGLLYVGWVGLLASLPCAAVWVWVMRGLAPTAAEALR